MIGAICVGAVIGTDFRTVELIHVRGHLYDMGDGLSGWQVRQVYLSGDRPDVVVNPKPKNLTWCKRLAKQLTDDADVGDCAYLIEPFGGWEEVNADPLARAFCLSSILYHVAAGDLPPELAMSGIRKLAQGEKSFVELLFDTATGKHTVVGDVDPDR